MGQLSLNKEGGHAAQKMGDAILNLLPIGAVIYDAQGRLLEANPKARELFGTSDLSSIRGDLFADPDLAPENRAALEQGRTVSYETLVDFGGCPTTKTGTMYLNIMIEPMRDQADGSIARYLVLFWDTTERKLASLALRGSEERFRKVFEEGGFGMVIVDRQFHFMRSNAAFCRLVGYSEEELRSLTFKDITHSEHVAADTNGVNKVFAGEIPAYKTEKRYVRRDGTVVWGSANITVVRDDHGRFLHFLTIVEDITERKRAERELVETTERLALATSAGRLGVWDWHVEENVMVWNDRMLELYGIARDRFTGNVDAWTNGLHPDDKQRALEECQRALAGEQDYDTEFRVLHPDGQVVHIKANGLVMRDHEGKAVRMIGTNADITERKRTEEALQNTQRLESLGLLAGGIAHDFNNLLTGIFGYAELARNHTRNETVIGYLSESIAVIDRARSLTRQLLTFARGGEPIRRVAPLFPFIEDAVHFALSGSNVSCRFDVAPDLKRCSFDRNQIGQVMDNLVINAQQAMPLGGVMDVRAANVEVKAGEHPGLPTGGYVKLSVQDQGVGIPRELLPRVFDPFFTTKPKGHGLGLATCYSIVKRHGGLIEIESELGKGSVVHVYLPVAAELTQTESSKATAGHRGSGTFVVVDDEDVVRDIVSRMLTACGYAVVCREDGRSALEYFARERQAGHTMAGMLLDLTIPGGMGGKETVRELRTLDADVPVFVASGYAEDPVMANPKAYGFTASICKPFRRVELEEMLERHMPPDARRAG
jgi:PAS domain S-box-containing protein